MVYVASDTYSFSVLREQVDDSTEIELFLSLFREDDRHNACSYVADAAVLLYIGVDIECVVCEDAIAV